VGRASERPHFDKAANIGFTFAGAFFVFIAAVGYHFYGSCVADTITLNLMRSSPAFGSLATLCTLASTFFSFPVRRAGLTRATAAPLCAAASHGPHTFASRLLQVFCVPTVRMLSAHPDTPWDPTLTAPPTGPLIAPAGTHPLGVRRCDLRPRRAQVACRPQGTDRAGALDRRPTSPPMLSHLL
jgi:hypothetical protein